jgi:lysozyme family protein
MMAAINFQTALALVLRHEAGYVDNPNDNGGATNLGITIKTLSAWRGRKVTKDEVRRLTKEDVAPIYRHRFWDVVRGNDLPHGLDYAVFDFAVNSGPERAAVMLQRAIGVEDDGWIGPVTLNAVWAADQHWLIDELMDQRLSFMKRLDDWQHFGRGWASRVASVREVALEMAKDNPVSSRPKFTVPAPAPVSVPPRPDVEPIEEKPAISKRPVIVNLFLAALAILSIGAVLWMLFSQR